MKIPNEARREVSKAILLGGGAGFVMQIALGLTVKGFVYSAIVIFVALLIWPEREKDGR